MAFAIARSETDVINNRAEGGHVFAAYRREWKSPTKEKASNLKSDMAIDKAIRSLSLTKSVHSPNNSEELGNDVDEDLPAEELGNDVDEELPDFQSIFGKDIPLDCLPLLDFGDPEDGPCCICDGPHAESYCGYRYHCPLDLKVGVDYKVICICGSDVINAKCEDGCICSYGQVMEKVPYTLERLMENGQ